MITSSRFIAIISLLILLPSTGSTEVILEEVVVKATRVEKPLREIPASVGQVDQRDIQLGKQQLGLDESLNRIPGLFMSNRYNFNQDLRISIRGFGTRSSFGVRGIRMTLDGIPITLPDGSSNLDNIDIGATRSIEVIRGPSSSLYGTAAGGAINLYSEDGPSEPYVEATTAFGSYGYKSMRLKAGGEHGKFNYFVSASRLLMDGYRDHSEIEKNLLHSKFRYEIDETSDITLTANLLDKPTAQDPGGLVRTATPFNVGVDTPEAAQRNNLNFDAGEEAEQQTFGLRYNKSIGELHEFTLRNYYTFRNFDARLPFGTPFATGGGIALDRFFTGGGGQYSYLGDLAGHDNRFTVGFDIDSQMDERKNFQNTAGTLGALTLDQDEDVFSWGIYIQNEFAISDDLELSLGLRYDEVEFDFSDHFQADGDQSGSAKFEEWSPQVGLLWQATDHVNLFAKVSTSFETPSTREFAPATGPGGFNTTLESQTATNYEVGVKGVLRDTLEYQLSLFHIDVTDELLPAGTNAGGSTFFVNAGETTRDGVEVALTYWPTDQIEMSLAYTYSDFEFDRFVVGGTSFAGNSIPGIPEHHGFAEIVYSTPGGFYAGADAQYVDKVFVDNGNTDAADSYFVANLRVGQTFVFNDADVRLFAGINNLFDEEYIGNVRVNEGNSRFFEPAPDRNAYAAVSVVFR